MDHFKLQTFWSNSELHRYTKYDVVASTLLQVSAASDGKLSRFFIVWASFICILSNLSNTRGLELHGTNRNKSCLTNTVVIPSIFS